MRLWPNFRLEIHTTNKTTTRGHHRFVEVFKRFVLIVILIIIMGAFVPPPSTATSDDEVVVGVAHHEQSSNNRPASSCRLRRNRSPMMMMTTTTTTTTTHRQVESSSSNATKTPNSTLFTVKDVRETMEKQETAQSSNPPLLWLILDNRVVNVTTFADKHQGGRQVLQVLANGCDATDAFLAYHPPQLLQRLSYYTIGYLVEDTDASTTDVTITDQSTTTNTSDDDKDDDQEEEEEAKDTGEEPQEQICILQQDNKSKQTRLANMSADFQVLHEAFLKEGLYKTSVWYYLQVFSWLTALLATSVALTLLGANPWIRVAGGLVLGLFLQQVAFVGHDLGHNAVTHSHYWDGYLGLMFGPLVSGISLEWWKSIHNLHHVAPNSVDYDLNIQHAPIMAIDSVMAKWFYQKKQITTVWAQSMVRFLLAHQDVTFFPFIFLLSRYNLYLRSFFFLLASKNTNMQHRTGDVLALVLFHVWTWSLVRTLPHWTEQIAFMVVSHAMANVINIQIVLSHFPMPIYRGRPIQPLPSPPHEKGQHPTSIFPHDHQSHSHHHHQHHDDTMNDCWAQVQVATALNVDCPPYMDWFHGGLQFQIEHHLWPRLPRHNLRVVQARTQAYCRQYNLPYHSAPFLPAVASVYQTMVQVAHDFRTSSEHATAFPINKNKTPSFMDSLVMKAMTMEG